MVSNVDFLKNVQNFDVEFSEKINIENTTELEAQIEVLKQEKQQLIDEVTALNEEIAENQEQIEEKERRIAELETQIEILNAQIAELEQDVTEAFEEGKQAENARMWNDITAGGERANFMYAFAYWGAEYIRPTIKIVPKGEGSARSILQACPLLKKIEASYFDFSQIPFGSGATNGYYYTFFNCPELEEIEDIGLSPSHTYAYTFASNGKLRKIAKITVDENTLFNNPFQYCSDLEEVIFYGVIGQNGINLRWSTKLNKASIKSLINTLSTTTSGLSVTLSKTAVENAFTGGSTGDEWLNLIATKNNWTITLS